MISIAKQSQVSDALEEMGLSVEILEEAIKRGESSRNRATPHHPPSWGGISAWADTTAALRDLIVPMGGTKDDTKNFSRVVLPDGENAIAVMAGDAGTGVEDQIPQPRYHRGAAAQDAVARSQLSLFAEELPERKGPRLWFLLVRRLQGAVRVELSRPASITEEGLVGTWETRIILPTISVDPTPSIENRPDFSDDLDIDVTRRA
jgi:hypothetical protein